MTSRTTFKNTPYKPSSLLRFFQALNKAGATSSEGHVGAALQSLPNVLRYRFTVAREINQAAAVCPSRNALIDDDGVLSYTQLQQQTVTVARWLVTRKEQSSLKSLRIAIMARNGHWHDHPNGRKGLHRRGPLFAQRRLIA